MSHVIKTSIDISAPVERIWQLLVDLDRYHEWNPFIVHARGRIAPGASFEVSPRATDGRQPRFAPQVTEYSEGRSFTWTGAFLHRGLALGDHTFRLLPLRDGTVRLEHDEEIYGIGAWLVWLVARKQIRIGFGAMNLALKERAEKGTD